tara:strand:+ start:859 stop:1371 length:513 start_codon:yes stop_codon:yes gene_type:complete
MSKKKIFLTLTGYQITWLACVFGEQKFNEPLLGIYIGSLYLLIFFYFNERKTSFLKLSLYICLPGYLFDTLMVFFSIYEFNTASIIGTIPAWMIILWFSFSTLFDEILTIFRKYKFTGILLSAFLGPFTYYLGEPIGIISINDIFLFLIYMIAFWGLLMIYYLQFILKKN